MVLSFSRAAEAMMFSVGWQAVEITTSADTQTTASSLLADPSQVLRSCPYIMIHFLMMFEMLLQKKKEKWRQDVSDTFRQWSHTCMALQFLNNLFGLKVPDVHHAVLRAWYNPLEPRGQRLNQWNLRNRHKCAVNTDLPACDWKVGEDAVLLILMTSVGLQTLRRERQVRWLETGSVADRQGDK